MLTELCSCVILCGIEVYLLVGYDDIRSTDSYHIIFVNGCDVIHYQRNDSFCCLVRNKHNVYDF